MGIYIFNWDVLKKYLEEDEADPNSKNDFGMNIIPALLRDGRKMYAYHFNGYWRDVGTIDSLWEANMEVLDPEHSGIDIFDKKWKIYSRNPVLPAQKIGPRAVVQDSLVTEGCKIYGRVQHSVLSAGVEVEEGATVEDAVLMDGVVVKAGRSGQALHPGGERRGRRRCQDRRRRRHRPCGHRPDRWRRRYRQRGRQSI